MIHTVSLTWDSLCKHSQLNPLLHMTQQTAGREYVHVNHIPSVRCTGCHITGAVMTSAPSVLQRRTPLKLLLSEHALLPVNTGVPCYSRRSKRITVVRQTMKDVQTARKSLVSCWQFRFLRSCTLECVSTRIATHFTSCPVWTRPAFPIRR